MSINTEINRLRNTKANLRIAIMEKGVTVFPTDLFSTYPTRISQISDTPGTYEDDLKKLLDGSLTSYTIPDGTERIRYGAFHNYTALTSVTIPASVTIIGERAFWNCSSLTSITCLSTTPPTIVGMDSAYEDLYPFKNTNNCPIYVPAASVDTYKAAWTKYASRIVGISPYATFNSIVDRSISGDYTIPSDVTSIGFCAFYSCTNLTSVTIHENVTEIGNAAFLRCTNLTSVTVLATTPPVLGSASNPFSGSYPIYVPAASVETYKTATGWTSLASRITAIPS